MDRRPRMRVLGYAGFALLLAACLANAYWEAFSVFQPWDDEGSHLETMRSFLSGSALYTQDYAYHGPFHFELIAALYRFSESAATSDNARFIVVAVWALTALAAGLAVQRLSGSVLLGFAAQIAWFLACHELVNEPGHPIVTTVLLLAIAGCALVAVPANPRLALIVVGAASGALLMTKVNVGILILLGVLFAAALTLPTLERLRHLAVAAGIALPFVLMSHGLGTATWLEFAVVVATGTAAIALMAFRRAGRSWEASERVASRSGLIGFAVAVLVLVAFAILILLPFGSHLGDVLQTAFIKPAGHPELFVVPLKLHGLSYAGCVVAAAIAWAVHARRLPRQTEPWVRIAAGLVIWLAIARVPSVLGNAAPLVIGSLLAWVAAAPLPGAEPSMWERFTRTAVAAVAVFETLHAYPVAGSQRSSAAVMFVFAGALCLRDGFALIDVPDLRRRAALATGVLAVLLLIGAGFIPTAIDHARTYRDNDALPFPGATRIHLPANEALLYKRLVFLIKRECTGLVSEPGYYSLNAWSGLRPVNDRIVNEWMPLLNTADQQSIVDDLSKYDRACSIRNHEGVAFWMQGRPVARRPLVDAIARMETVASVGAYELAVPAARAQAVARDLAKVKLP